MPDDRRTQFVSGARDYAHYRLDYPDDLVGMLAAHGVTVDEAQTR